MVCWCPHAQASSRSCCADLVQQLLARVQDAAGGLEKAGQLLGQARAGLVAGRSSDAQLPVEESSLDKVGSIKTYTDVCGLRPILTNLLLGFLQVVSGLDDALMCLAELQLQQEGTDSCGAALGKACRCVNRLQESLAVDPASPSANRVLVEVRPPGCLCWLCGNTKHAGCDWYSSTTAWASTKHARHPALTQQRLLHSAAGTSIMAGSLRSTAQRLCWCGFRAQECVGTASTYRIR